VVPYHRRREERRQLFHVDDAACQTWRTSQIFTKCRKYAKSKITSKNLNSVIYERISMRFEVFESTRRAALVGYDASVTDSGFTILRFEKPKFGRPSSDFDETGCFRGF
jgi:hypothetical protein